MIRRKASKKKAVPEKLPQSRQNSPHADIGGTRQMDELELKKLRIRKARRKEKMRRKLIVFVFLLVCTGVIFTVFKAPFFNIKSVLCVGQTTLTEAEIIKAADVKVGENIFMSNIGQMKARIAGIPRVAESNVRRLFPNRIKIWVREAKECAYIETGDGGAVITDINGKILEAASISDTEKLSQIARLEGVSAASAVPGEMVQMKDDKIAETVYKCMKELSERDMLDSTSYINAALEGELEIMYDDRLRIILGSYDDLDYKLNFINKVRTENLSEYEKATLDFRGDKLYAGPFEDIEAQETEKEGDGIEHGEKDGGEKNKNDSEKAEDKEKDNREGQE